MFKSILALVCALAFTAFAPSAQAQNWGIRFDQMPVGTEYVVRNQSGDTWSYKYVGSSNGQYLMEEINHQNNRKYRLTYDSRGHFVQSRTARGSKYRRLPRGCYMVVGTCTHVVSGSRRNNGKYVYNVRQAGPKKRVGTWRRVNTEETRDFSYTLGKYNIIVYSEYQHQGETKFRKVTRITAPGG